MYAQQEDFAMSHFDVFDSFFREMLGDLDGYDDLETVCFPLQYLYFSITSIILTTAMLNMLISIISESYGNLKEDEKMTRNFELINILTESDVQEDKIQTNENKFLIYIYNDSMEEDDVTDLDILKEKIESESKSLDSIKRNILKLTKMMSNHIKEEKNLTESSFKKLSKRILKKK